MSKRYYVHFKDGEDWLWWSTHDWFLAAWATAMYIGVFGKVKASRLRICYTEN